MAKKQKTAAPRARRRGAASTAVDGAIYRIHEAAEIAGVSPTTVRVWERSGLVVSQRGKNGYRYFDEAAIQRLRRVAHLRKVEQLNVEGIRRALAEDDGSVEPTPPDESLGARLRKLRKAAGRTLEEAGEASGLSASFLSALERNLTGASPESIHKLAHSYGSSFSAIMRREAPELVQFKSSAERGKRVMHGLEVDQLIDGETSLDANICTMKPGWDTGGPYKHEGEEVIFMIEGSLEVSLSTGEKFLMKRGDSLFYPSTIPHSWRNPGRKPNRFVWSATPPSY